MLCEEFSSAAAPRRLKQLTQRKLSVTNQDISPSQGWHLGICSRLSPHVSSNDLIRSRQHVGRNRQADLLGCFQIDDEFELDRLLHREISRLGAFQNLVHIRGGTPEQVSNARAVGHKPTGFHIFWKGVYRWQPVLCRKFCNLCSVRIEDGGRQHENRLSPLLACGSEGGLNILGT